MRTFSKEYSENRSLVVVIAISLLALRVGIVVHTGVLREDGMRPAAPAEVTD